MLCVFEPRHYSVFSDVPSNPYSVRLSAVSQRLATVTFMKPDSHGGVPISYYLVQYKEVGSQDWRDVKSHSVQSESCSLSAVIYPVCCRGGPYYVFLLWRRLKAHFYTSTSISVSWLWPVESLRWNGKAFTSSHAHLMDRVRVVNVVHSRGGKKQWSKPVIKRYITPPGA